MHTAMPPTYIIHEEDIIALEKKVPKDADHWRQPHLE
jgi:hypothetical protein